MQIPKRMTFRSESVPGRIKGREYSSRPLLFPVSGVECERGLAFEFRIAPALRIGFDAE